MKPYVKGNEMRRMSYIKIFPSSGDFFFSCRKFLCNSEKVNLPAALLVNLAQKGKEYITQCFIHLKMTY